METSAVLNSHIAVSNLRAKCSIIQNYPLHRIDLRGNLVDIFPEGSPYHRFAMNLQNYERFLATSMTQESAIVRYLLGDRGSTTASAMVTPKLAAIYSYHVSALLAAYRLLDLELLHSSPDPTMLPPLYSNCITPQMVEKATIKDRWRKLGNWQQLLIEFRNLYGGISQEEEGVVSIVDSPLRGSLAHLQGLAETHSNQKFSNVIQNFRGAALHWTLMHEMARLNTHELPAIPESISAIIDQATLHHVNEMYQPRTREKMGVYLREHSRGELVLPLHLSLMVTPCFLLMPTILVKSNFPRQSIYQLSCALGNQKPKILVQVEKEIWNAFSRIREDSSMKVVHSVFRQFLDSNPVREVLNMSPTDPLFSFFQCEWPRGKQEKSPVYAVVFFG
ncbi:hypothetical protein HYPSUDRAFT_34182 [Hypholoma sublateritium FD-334 SS-4]|uniref:Uncharacterized protein n=1 Tax=Hypholoma sublateritium (strain FD-334 SS-4) TaxID=945553 RepID=A0A0D2PHH5_HYPSF|nr:hypothetical protein HYPSUDRAFT_34182 [Hypholoma sublateritium FD-334 SS-4]